MLFCIGLKTCVSLCPHHLSFAFGEKRGDIVFCFVFFCGRSIEWVARDSGACGLDIILMFFFVILAHWSHNYAQCELCDWSLSVTRIFSLNNNFLWPNLCPHPVRVGRHIFSVGAPVCPSDCPSFRCFCLKMWMRSD